MASPLTYSWLGNAYQLGCVNLVLADLLDVTLSFAAFAGGSPSPNRTYVKVAQNTIFIPPGKVSFDPRENKLVLNTFQVTLDPKRVPVKMPPDIILGNAATATKFMKALAARNTIVGFLGHGNMAQGQTFALGLCFEAIQLPPSDSDPNPPPGQRCLVPEPLTHGTLNGNPITFVQAAGFDWVILPNGFTPKAAIVFVASCGVDDNFIAQWHLNGGQALIVPLYSDPQGTEALNQIDLDKSAIEWNAMLGVLANGGTVDAAVSKGNEAAAGNGSAHTWRRIGDGSVTLQ
jgi:hypothetical protein